MDMDIVWILKFIFFIWVASLSSKSIYLKHMIDSGRGRTNAAVRKSSAEISRGGNSTALLLISTGSQLDDLLTDASL